MANPKIGPGMLVYAIPVGASTLAPPVGNFNENYYVLKPGSPVAQSIYTPADGYLFRPDPGSPFAQLSLPFNNVAACAVDPFNRAIVQIDRNYALRVLNLDEAGNVKLSQVSPARPDLAAALKVAVPTWYPGQNAQPLGYSGNAGLMSWASSQVNSLTINYSPEAGFAVGIASGYDSPGQNAIVFQPAGVQDFFSCVPSNVYAGAAVSFLTGARRNLPSTNSLKCYGPLFDGYLVVGVYASNTRGAFYTRDFSEFNPLHDGNGLLDFEAFGNSWLGGTTSFYGPQHLCLGTAPGALAVYNTMYLITRANIALNSPSHSSSACGC